MVFRLIENSKEYTSKAKEYHNCSLELSSLYNGIENFKTLKDNPSLEEKLKFAQKISNDYRRILEKIENYEPIGNDIFKSKTAKYHNLNWFDVIKIKLNTTKL